MQTKQRDNVQKQQVQVQPLASPMAQVNGGSFPLEPFAAQLRAWWPVPLIQLQAAEQPQAMVRPQAAVRVQPRAMLRPQAVIVMQPHPHLAKQG